MIISVLSNKLSEHFNIPALLLFLAIGMFAGTGGTGKIPFDDPRLSYLVGTAALAFILFSGGLSTHWKSIRPIVGCGISLATVGVLLTALLVGLFAHYVLDFPLKEGFLLGAIVSSTDAAAVLELDSEFNPPTVAARSDAIRVDYSTGHESIDLVPPLACQAVLTALKVYWGNLDAREVETWEACTRRILAMVDWGCYR